jgi:WD40 repeat protein
MSRHHISILLLSCLLTAAEPPLDRHGDPLPPGAIARLGTSRWRHSFTLHAIVPSPDGKTVATTGGYSTGRKIVLWDAADGRQLHDLQPPGCIESVAYTPDSRTLLAATREGVIAYDVATGKETKRYGAAADLRVVAVSPDGRFVASGGADGMIRVWDVAGEELFSEKPNAKRVQTLAFGLGGRTLAWSGEEGILRLWNLDGDTPGWEARACKEYTAVTLFTPDGKSLITAGIDAPPIVWDAATGKKRLELGPADAKGNSYAALSRDGKTIAWSRESNLVHLTDLATGKEIRNWEAHVLQPRTIAFSPDGKTLLTGGTWSAAVRRWDVATGKEIGASPIHTGSIHLVAFTNDGQSVLSYGRDDAVIRWNVATGVGDVCCRVTIE